MENTYKITDIVTESELQNIADVAISDGLELAHADGIEFDITVNTCNGNTLSIDNYKQRLFSNSLNDEDLEIINKYKSM